MSDIFRPLFRSVEDKVANRRDQLRKAQKTFRERRDQYLRTLEKTVKRLHSSEASLQSEVERLKHDLATTKNNLLQKEADLFKLQQAFNGGGLQPNSGWNGLSFSSSANAAHAYLSPSHESPNSEAESFASSAATLVWVESRNDQPVQMHVQPKDDVQIVPGGRSGSQTQRILAVSPILKKNVTAYVSQLDVVIVAMEFVLKLESPCLPHIRQGDDNDSNAAPLSPSEKAKTPPHGHVHTASTALLCCSPASSPLSSTASTSYSLSSPTSATLPGSSWSVYKSTLDRLLDTSEDLPLDQSLELTPVQVWSCIAQTPGFGKLQISALDQMSDRLLVHIKCYGFGAVVRTDFLTRLLAEY